MKRYNVLLVALAAVLLASPRSVYSQTQGALPSWTDDARRNAAYPVSEWYVGYALGTIGSKDRPEEVRRRVENEARNELAKGISVHIEARSTGVTGVAQQKTGGSMSETIKKDYRQTINATVNAKVSGVEVISHHDQAENKIYALARVKKSDLAAYYVRHIERYLHDAENDLKLARQHFESDRKGSALEKNASAKKNIYDCENGGYYEMLVLVDFKGDVKRLKDRSYIIQKEIAELEARLSVTAATLITGKETMIGNSADIVIPGLQSKFTEKGCRVADAMEDAGYVLTVEVADCQLSKEGAFYYCYACVKADLVNTKTGKSDAKLNFTGPKAGWTDAERACRKAFEGTAEALWKQISEKTEVCR